MKKFIVGLLFVPSMAMAEFQTGNQLYQKITSSIVGEQMYAMGYVAGVFDAWQHIDHCPPANVLTLGQVYDMVKNHLEANPSTRHRTADMIIRDVLKRTWPCANNSNRGGTRL